MQTNVLIKEECILKNKNKSFPYKKLSVFYKSCLKTFGSHLVCSVGERNVPPHNQNTVRSCKQITLLVLQCATSRLVTLLKVLDAPLQVSDILSFSVSLKLINFNFQLFLPFVPVCLLASHLTLCRLSTLLWFGSCIHCILACFL